MRQMMKRLWNDDGGALIATEWLFIVTIMVIGLVVGFVYIRNYVVSELTETAFAVGTLDQSYRFSGITGCPDQDYFGTAGSAAQDSPPNFVKPTGATTTVYGIHVDPCSF